ncbi:MAG: thioredoxin-dependent thiol peroxidase [Candidatus Rifleibacteriota bacterium]
MVKSAENKLKAGDKAPAFSLKDQNGKGFSSKDLAGGKFLVYFYPRASTPGCTVQACSVRDSLAVFRRAAFKIVAISPDQPEKLKKFDEKQGLGFTLLSDPDMSIASAFGVVGEKTSFGKTSIGIIRSSFLIDEKGRVIEAWYKVKPEETVPLALEKIGAE